ncbi:MAG: hypothetical protein CMJ78_13400 [Planctomycetaceae bacterium]|nr:hypothetical protein [Planctomycetaceae bacterium]
MATSNDEVTALDQPERPKKARHWGWVAFLHVLKSAFFIPYPVKYLLFVILATSGIRTAPGVAIWVTGTTAISWYTLRRSFRTIRNRLDVSSPERAIKPILVGFGILAFVSILLDLALITNSGARVGPLIVLSLAFNFGIYAYQVIMSHREFAKLPGANGELPIKMSDLLAAIGDIGLFAAILVGLIVLLT